MKNLIDFLTNKHLVWRGRDSRSAPSALSSGFADLDNKLAGGLPECGVINIHSPVGIGELRLLMPSLYEASSMGASPYRSPSESQTRLNVFINPPGWLCAEFLQQQGFSLDRILVIYPRKKNETLWAAEQCLKSGACSAVMLWQDQFETHHIKRLQLACEEGQCRQFLFRSLRQPGLSLPVALSMNLNPHEQGLEVQITKRKGGWPVQQFVLDMSSYWPYFSVQQSNNIIPFPAGRTHQAR